MNEDEHAQDLTDRGRDLAIALLTTRIGDEGVAAELTLLQEVTGEPELAFGAIGMFLGLVHAYVETSSTTLGIDPMDFLQTFALQMHADD